MDMKDLCVMARRERQHHIRTVLATVVHVQGHAYRKEGVSMLLTEDGRHYGTISPGCLEEDLCGRVESAWNSCTVQMVEYDMRPADDLSWGENVGCGGCLHILLEPVRGELEHILETLDQRLEQGEAVMLSRSFVENGPKVEYRLSSTAAEPGDPARSVPLTEESASAVSPGVSQTLFLAHNRDPEYANTPSMENKKYTFIRTYRPKPRLILIGAGDDSRLVSSLAQASGFRVVVGDWREALCTDERFPGAVCITGFPAELYTRISPQIGDYMLLMSHNFPREREWIELIEDCPYAYLGIMGSSERTRRLFDQLPAYPHVHSPVGLSIGADGPDEIAISIAAELIAVKRDRKPQPREGSAHAYRRIGTGSR
ncbi:XdhC family protein [Paenibacillus wulumuqiensis]|uniref:XdhC family protein n=1 Tax=Paenibacillus wulumuqiensis TaxID=1567107 RepID=UPI0006990708|nr:XdhC family protein [Paenibacillus wulumuqiensis]